MKARTSAKQPNATKICEKGKYASITLFIYQTMAK